MSKIAKKSELCGCKVVVRYILQGLSRDEISKVICCSRSAVSYKIAKLFKLYNVKNKHEFIIKVFSELLDKKNKIIEKQKLLIEKITS